MAKKKKKRMTVEELLNRRTPPRGDLLAAATGRVVEESLPADIEAINVPENDIVDVIPATETEPATAVDRKGITYPLNDEQARKITADIMKDIGKPIAAEDVTFSGESNIAPPVSDRDAFQGATMDKVLDAISNDDPEKAHAFLELFQRGLKEDLSPEFLEADSLIATEERRAGKTPSFQFSKLGAGTQGVKAADDIIRSERQELKDLIKLRGDIDTDKSLLKLRKAGTASDVATAGLKRDALRDAFKTTKQKKVEQTINDIEKEIGKIELRATEGKSIPRAEKLRKLSLEKRLRKLLPARVKLIN